MRILLIEDEKRLADALVCILEKEGFITDAVFDGTEGYFLAETDNYDVIILDRMLPGMDGIEILDKLRNHGIKTPTIFLTAKDTVKNRIEGLNIGADDYLIKPFSKDELIARIRAITRRSQSTVYNSKIQLGLLLLDVSSCKAHIEDKHISLSFKETQLLEFLIRNCRQTLSKEQILNRVWGFDSDVEFKNIDLYIYYLRKKIDFSSAGITLETIRGIGYIMKEMVS